jgi:hypothetical protein
MLLEPGRAVLVISGIVSRERGAIRAASLASSYERARYWLDVRWFEFMISCA